MLIVCKACCNMIFGIVKDFYLSSDSRLFTLELDEMRRL